MTYGCKGQALRIDVTDTDKHPFASAMGFHFNEMHLHFLHRKLQKPFKLPALHSVRFLRTSAKL